MGLFGAVRRVAGRGLGIDVKVISKSADIHLSVITNSYGRMYI